MKSTVKIVIVGHVDHGKSTLIGRLLLSSNSLPQGKMKEVKKISKELGKEAELAYLVDCLKEERENNVTIDTTQIFFKTARRDYVIIDAPGHLEFIKNMISGTTLAEAAVLIVDTKEGIREQTRRHAFLISMLGIDKLIVVFNKMDLIDYDRERFERLKTEILEFLKTLKITPSFIVPISAREGENINSLSSRTAWYKGPALLTALDSLKLRTERLKRPLRFPVQDVYEMDGERIIVGRVSSGEIKERQKIVIFPSGRKARIKEIKVFGRREKKAFERENIGLTLSDSSPVKRGEVIVSREEPPEPILNFKGNIFWMSEDPLRTGEKMVIRCATQEVRCVAERIVKRINSSTLEIIEENAGELKLNEAGVVFLKTEEPVIAGKFSFIEELGRFVIERDYNLQGVGIIV